MSCQTLARSAAVLGLVCVPLAPTRAQEGEGIAPTIVEQPVHRGTTLRVRGAGWFSRADGMLIVGDPIPEFPLAIRELDLQDTLNLDTDETVFWGQASLHFGRDRRWMIGGGYSGPFRYEGRTEPLQIAFRDRVFEGQIESDARFHIFEINSGYDVSRGDRHAVTLGVSTRIFDVRASLEGTATDPDTGNTEQRRERVTALVPIPGPALGLRLDASERLFIRGRASGIWLGNWGHFVDASAEVGYDISRNLGVFAGYRWLRAEADVSDIEFDLTLDGIYAGAEIRF
jgi:hypothetical protein